VNTPSTLPDRRGRRHVLPPALGFLPGLILLSLALTFAQPIQTSAQTVAPGLAQSTNLAPWGKLERVRITIERPRAMISASAERYPRQTEWFFGTASDRDLEDFFEAAGLPPQAVDPSSWLHVTGGIRVPVDPDLAATLSNRARQAIYPMLARYEQNTPQSEFYAFPPQELEDWFARSGLAPATIEWVTNRFYVQGGLTCFADLGEALHRIDSAEEKLRLVKTLSRETTLLLKLHVDDSTDIDGLINYWGLHGRAKSIEPLLESLKRLEGGASIDVVHLLPPFARQRLYTYPFLAGSNTNAVQDCYWTAFNFFAEDPEYQYGNTAQIAAAIEKHYQRVRETPHMGDLMLLANQQGKVVHAANYIADDIVFTKNGAAPTRPWLLMPISDLLAIYTDAAPPRVVYYRLKDLP